jgi:hypothetical protein
VNDFSEELTAQGKDGEAKARLLLKDSGFMIAQIDWLCLQQISGKYYSCEIKEKERFVGRPGTDHPFDAQGLSPYQVNFRSEFYKKTGIRCIFMVFEMSTNCWYWNFLDVLENLEEYKHGISPIKKVKTFSKDGKTRLYELSAFNVLPYGQKLTIDTTT